MSGLIPGNVHVMGDTGQFYTIVTVNDNNDTTNCDVVDDGNDDVLVCGRCKQQFSKVDAFLEHKANHCRSKKTTTRKLSSSHSASSKEIYLALDSPILTHNSSQLSNFYFENSDQIVPIIGQDQEEGEKFESKKLSTINQKSGLEISLVPSSKKVIAEKVDTIPINNGKKKEIVKNNNKLLFCSYCHKGFSKNFDLAQHVRSHTGERPYQCVICGRGFAQKSNVKKHMTTHKVWPLGHKTLPNNDISEQKKSDKAEEEDGTTMEGTEITKINVDTIETHKDIQQQTSVKTGYQCPYCQQTLDKYTDFKTHLKLHEEEKSYKCTVRGCGQLFQDLDLFLDHTSSHENKQYRCHVCSKMFDDLNQLNLHSYVHLTDEQTREKQFFQCSKCKNKYTSMEALDHHLDTASHSFSCDICDKEFAAERFLRKHLAVTHSEGLYECKVCNKKMKNESYLKSHMMIHTGELPFSCKECGMKFNRKDKLKRHSLTHSDNKKFKCPFKDHMGCEKEFHRFDKLKLHIMTHGNIKPFKCDICEGGFSRKEHLTAHIAKIHLGGKGNFNCKICDIKVNSNTELQDHVNQEHKRTSQSLKGKGRKKFKSSDSTMKIIDDFTGLISTEYILPESIETETSGEGQKSVDTSSAKSLETFTNSNVGTPETQNYRPKKFSQDKAENLQSTVGSAASKALEVLYSGDGNS